MSVQEIQTAIVELPPSELASLVEWIEEYQADAWDKQIEDDLKTGRLDTLLAEAEKEHKAGLTRPLQSLRICQVFGSTVSNCLRRCPIGK